MTQPIACDMSAAPDTPEERLADYRRLFERALLRRERRPDGLVLAFRADPGIRAAVDDLARREAACCPFLHSRVEAAGDELTWTISSSVAGDDRVMVDAILDAFYDLPGLTAAAS